MPSETKARNHITNPLKMEKLKLIIDCYGEANVRRGAGSILLKLGLNFSIVEVSNVFYERKQKSSEELRKGSFKVRTCSSNC